VTQQDASVDRPVVHALFIQQVCEA
jgi:hypothetical protein